MTFLAWIDLGAPFVLFDSLDTEAVLDAIEHHRCTAFGSFPFSTQGCWSSSAPNHGEVIPIRLVPRDQTITLMLEPLPSTLPIDMGIARPFNRGFAVALKDQSCSPRRSAGHRNGSMMSGTSSLPPASSTRTLTSAFSPQLNLTIPTRKDKVVVRLQLFC